ncbi:hypothetical protein GQ44DRAFT_259189 [Phaeosphaeriaceae sp. PMI808]|nr:hypothetical protein GQ44DRAFT_259189 [Phaeosphaeriaceae sp. PMI808]
MSSYPDYQIRTAQKISIQRVEEHTIRRPSVVGFGGGWWTRDPSIKVTSTISKSTPYDHSAPLSSSQTNTRPKSQRPCPLVSQYLNCQTPPTGAYHHTPLPSPRGGSNIVQNDLCYTLTSSTAFPSTQRLLFESQNLTQINLYQRRCDGPRLPSLVDNEEFRPKQLLRQNQRRDFIQKLAPKAVDSSAMLGTVSGTKPKACLMAKPKIRSTNQSIRATAI